MQVGNLINGSAAEGLRLMYVALFLIVGSGMIALAVVILRLNSADRKRFRGAERATGEVIEIVRGGPDRARIQFTLRGRAHVIALSAKQEDGAWYLTYSLGDRVRLLVPPHRPQDAAPAGEVRNLYGLPAAVGFMGLTALGFGLLSLTKSAEIAVALLAGVFVGMFVLFSYTSRK